MKALTILQPWATLVAIGAKRIETRSWLTPYRGPLAIHAGKGWSPRAAHLCEQELFRSALQQAGISSSAELPKGFVIAVCELVDCTAIDGESGVPPEPEQSFGIYTAGRFSWHLANVRVVSPPIPAVGRQRLWELSADTVRGDREKAVRQLPTLSGLDLDRPNVVSQAWR